MGKFEDGLAKGIDGTFAFVKRKKYIVLFILNLWIAYLVYQGIWAAEFAEQHGCKLHEGYSNPCVVDGKEWADILYSKFTVLVLMSFAAPLFAIPLLLLILFLIIDGIKFFVRRKNRNNT